MLPLEVKECGVGEVPQRLSTATRPMRWMAVRGAVAFVTGSEREEVKWVHNISEFL
jgi:hypothetical protein